MSYLAFHDLGCEARLPGHEVAYIAALAQDALAEELALAENRPLRAELGLPVPASTLYESQLFWLMSDGETHRLQGQDVYVFSLALNVLYRRRPAAGLLCWLYDHALGHGWVTAADRQAFAAEIQAAIDAGAARPAMGWDAVLSFLHGGAGDVATSLAIGNTFPDGELALRAGTWTPELGTLDDPDGDELDMHWDRLDSAERWDRCMRALRARPWLQWRPGGTSYVFGDFTIRRDAGLIPARPGR